MNAVLRTSDLRRLEMWDEDEVRDDSVDRGEASEPRAVETATSADDDDDVVDAHVWRAQT